MTAAALPSSHAQRGAGCAKSSGNSSASACAELSPSSSDDSDRQYSTACSTHSGAAPVASSGVKSGRKPAAAASARCTCRKRLTRLAASSRWQEAARAARDGVVMIGLLTARPRARPAATRRERPRAGAPTGPRARPDRPRARGSDRPDRPTRRAGASRRAPCRPCGCLRAQVPLQRPAPVGIEAQAGLVEHQDGGVGQVEHREPEPLARAARQPAGDDAAGTRRGPSVRSTDVDTRERQAAQPRVEREDLRDRQSRVEAGRLRQERQRRPAPRGRSAATSWPITQRCGRRRPPRARKQPQRGRLAAAVGADEQRDLARAGIESDRSSRTRWRP